MYITRVGLLPYTKPYHIQKAHPRPIGTPPDPTRPKKQSSGGQGVPKRSEGLQRGPEGGGGEG